ncbi:Similar to hypothetical protein AOR_1_932164 [Aspergillus oryzae RIB40]; acc. no. XP_003189429 [Pyronema omphalodes CBS 100304]|uniref:Nephrocystin 3-like N-terminal domain-containing protein n=1 Tax=Pyronema omphalodes (strain CBS 100304) TaxID=1076935 RepID=U4KZH3_PYROM|nr:Similar to hypothetical protein AOR_1_932164 [Aspergillus oryzae RIB40]; acc. no. XP_003189429 [Pyronema omphalodes CBS 100304]
MGLTIKLAGEVRAKSKDKEFEKLLQWISPSEPNKRHDDIKHRRMDNTGDCFLKDEKFEKWYDIQGLEKDSSPLFVCSGIPGAGKSVMSSLVIDEISKELFTGGNSCLAYVHCDYKDQGQQTARNLIGVMLK